MHELLVGITNASQARYIKLTSQPLYDKHTLAGNGILLLPNADAHLRPYCIRFPLVYFVLSHFFIALMYIVLHLGIYHHSALPFVPVLLTISSFM